MSLSDVAVGVVAIGKAMGVTLKNFLSHPITVQYPEEPIQIFPRFRGRHELHRYIEVDLERCVGCALCEAACPTGTIYVEAAENDPEHPRSPGERYARVYEINLLHCMFCGYCTEACPTEAIRMGHEFALANYDRRDLVLDQQQLLVIPKPNVVVKPEE